MLKILIIDDNNDNIISLKAIIYDSFPGAFVITALEGSSGISLARSNDPDVVLLDIVMPEMDGFEVCRILKADERIGDVPVVFVTALKGDRENRLTALDVGADGFLSKPIDATELVVQIRAMEKVKQASRQKRDEQLRLSMMVADRTHELQMSQTATLNLLDDLKVEIEARIRSEETLRESEAFLTSIIENLPHMIFLKDAKDLKFVRFNKAGEELLGYDRNELIGKSDYDFFSKEQADSFILTDHQVLDSGTMCDVPEETINTRLGVKIIQTKKIPICDQNGKALFLLGISEDITQRKIVEQKLKQQTYAMDAAIDGIAILDAQQNYTYLNTAHLEIYGYESPQELIGKTWRILYKEEELVRFDNEIMPVFAKDGCFRGTAEGLKKDGTTFPQEISLTALENGGLICVVRNISERKRVETALIESEAAVKNKLKALLEPEGDIGNLILEDILDTEALQLMLDDFYKLTGIGSAIVDNSGKVLLAVGWQEVCTKFHRCHPDTLVNCLESDTVLSSGVKYGSYKAYKCKNHLWDVVTPIHVGGRHLGNLFYGQYFYEDENVDLEVFRNQARKYGFDEEEYLGAISHVPRWKRETIDTAMVFFSKISDIISSLSFSTIRLSRTLADHKRAELALRKSEQRHRLLAEHLSDVIWTMDIEGHFTYVSPSVEKMRGYTVAEVMEQTMDDFLTPESAALAKEAFVGVVQAVMQGDHASEYRGELEQTRKDGSTLWTEVTVSILKDDDGNFVGVTGVTRDIRERKRAEEQIRKLNEDLERKVIERTAQLQAANNEMESFSYSVSHDLRAPLRAMDGFARILIEDYARSLDTEGRRLLDAIMSNAIRMGNLIDDLLAFSRLSRQEIVVSSVDMNLMVNTLIQELSAETDISLVHIHVNDLPKSLGDPTMLRQVWANLISNAIKFTSHKSERFIDIGAYTEQGCSVYFVKDNGAGFDMTYANKLFGVFQRLHTTKQFEGTGVGLAIVHRIVSRLNGRVWAQATVDEGATFYFVLPIEK